MAKPLRVGIVGMVSAYSVHYAEDLGKLPDVEVVGIAHLGRDAGYVRDSLSLPWLKGYPKTAAEFEGRWGIPVVESAEELFDSGAGAVAICTEDYLHCRYAAQALERDIHVLIPKPFASTMREAAILREAASRSRATLTPSLPNRHNALWQAAKAALGDDGIGEPLSARAQATHHLSFGPWKSDPTMAAGPEFEVGFYHVDGLRYLFGPDEPVRVYASARNSLHMGVPFFDVAQGIIDFASGAVATMAFYCGCHYPFPNQDLDLMARDGGLRIERDYARDVSVLRVFTAESL